MISPKEFAEEMKRIAEESTTDEEKVPHRNGRLHVRCIKAVRFWRRSGNIHRHAKVVFVKGVDYE